VDAKYILGGPGNVWTEHIPTLRQAQYMTWPRGWALAEVYWSPKGSKNWENFIPRVENHFGRSDMAEVNCSHAVYDAIIRTSLKNEKLVIEMDTEVPGLVIFYTTDGTMPDNYSNEYSKPFELPEGPVGLRVITYRNGKPIGHLIILKQEDLRRRIGR
jgi:hexosaminidase